MDLNVNDLERTALIPLIARARATQDPSDPFCDPWSVRLVEQLDAKTVAAYEKKHISRGCMVREKTFDERVRQAHERWGHDFTVVTLGAGLDARPYRLEEAAKCWIDVDLPGGIELRRSVYEEGPKHRFVAKDLTSPDLVDSLAIDRGPVLVLSAGVLMYIPLEQVNSCFEGLRALQPVHVLMDSASPWFVEHVESISKGVKKGDLKWGLTYDMSESGVLQVFPPFERLEFCKSYGEQGMMASIPWAVRGVFRLFMRRKIDSLFIEGVLRGPEV